MGRYNEIYGQKINTPTFMAIARQSTVFRNAFSAAPTCSPSRAALLTGMAPHSAGIFGLAHRGFEITDTNQHLSAFLKKKGYKTALFGVQHEVANPYNLAYDTCFSPTWGADHDDYISEKAVDYIQTLTKKDTFFLSVGLFYPHRVFRKSVSGRATYVTVPPCLPDNKSTREDFADYIESVEYADQKAALVINALKKADLYDQTLIILTTDHGIAFPYMKCNLYDNGTGITLAIKLPHQKIGALSDALISQIDIFPTLCDMLDEKKPDWLQGKSFYDILKGENMEINDAVFSEITYHASFEPQRAIRTKRWKYICRYKAGLHPVLPNIDAGKSKTYLVQNGFADRVYAREELYDLIYDPQERNNLADKPEFKDITKSLSAKLFDWQKRTGDPLLERFRNTSLNGWYDPEDRIDPDTGSFFYCKDKGFPEIVLPETVL